MLANQPRREAIREQARSYEERHRDKRYSGAPHATLLRLRPVQALPEPPRELAAHVAHAHAHARQVRGGEAERGSMVDFSLDATIDEEGETTFLDRLEDGGPSPQESFLSREQDTEIQEALATVPEKHRAILLLREIEGMSYEDLARTLDIPKGTVMSRLFHARAKVQKILGDYLELDEAKSGVGNE